MTTGAHIEKAPGRFGGADSVLDHWLISVNVGVYKYFDFLVMNEDVSYAAGAKINPDAPFVSFYSGTRGYAYGITDGLSDRLLCRWKENADSDPKGSSVQS